MKKIVSANYLDPKAKKRWLVRDESYALDEAKPVRSLECTGVEFKYTGDYAAIGFGCTVIAICDTAEERSVMKKPAGLLRFEVSRFLDKSSGVNIASCKRLVLDSKGGMYYE